MGTNTLETAYVNGQTIDAAHTNELTQAMIGSFVGRDTSGVPATGRSLGTLALPWGNIYGTGLILNGVALDTSLITSSPNRVVSGAQRALSSMPDFIRADGAALEFDVLGLTTNLVLAVNNVATTVSTDISKTGITAAPSSNNTCLVNDSTMSGDKYAGEDGTSIIIDTVGTEISSRVGQIIALKRTNEIMLAYVKSATELTDVRRGYFFDSSGNPLVREALANNDALTILSLGWVFIEDNGTTVDVSYRTPVYSYSSPSSPVTGDYWYDLANNIWKRYSGATFEIINRTLVGMVASNTTACIASRCLDFSKSFQSLNNLKTEITSTEIIKSKGISFITSVYGSNVEMLSSKTSWNITSNLESGLTEANSTMYYLYFSDDGQQFISDEKPHSRPELHGHYHPFHSWRCVGELFNNAAGNIEYVSSFKYNPNISGPVALLKDVKASATSSGTFTAGSWQTRILNTEEDSDGIVTLGSNQFWIYPGKYKIKAHAPAYSAETHKLKLRNITDSTDEIIGNANYAMAASSGVNSYAELEGIITVKTPKVFELQHRCSSTFASTGLGIAAGMSVSEVFAAVSVKRVE